MNFLYHGTCERVAEKAVYAGLKPRGVRKGNYAHTVESNTRGVYLTDSAFALHFAGNATLFPADGRLAIIEIDRLKLHPLSLFADEDAAEQKIAAMPNLTREQRTRFFRDRLIDLTLAGFGWQESLDALGTCSHLGEIIPRAFTRVAYINREARLLLVLNGVDPTINAMNRKLLGERYKKMIRCIFGDEEPEKPSGDFLQDMLTSNVIHPDVWAEIRVGIEVQKL